MFILLVSFGYNPINFKKYDENVDYDENIIFYLVDTEENLKNKMLENKIDGILLFRTFNDNVINYIIEKKMLFLQILTLKIHILMIYFLCISLKIIMFLIEV